MQGVFLDIDSLDKNDLNLEALTATLPQWQFHPETKTEQVASRIADATVVVSNKVVLNRQALTQAKKLRLIAVAATGTNNVDIQAATELGISVCNARAYATPSVVQHVFALLLNLSRHINEYQTAIQAGHWQHSKHFCLLDYSIHELSGRKLGIIGFGELGKAVAQVAENAFGMQVLIAQRDKHDQRPGRLPLHELLTQVDVLSLHCPLNEDTQELIGAEELSLMKPTALLINTARGGIVDEVALADALRNGQLAGAGVDVLTEEPPVKGNPLLAVDIPHLIITPHIAWASREARQRLVDQLRDNIDAFLKKRPQNLVNL